MTHPSNIPIPDPSDLTMQALDRLRTDLLEQIERVEQKLIGRVEREREALTAVKNLLDERIEGHWRLDTERFAAQKEALIKTENANAASRNVLSERIDGAKESISNLERSLSNRISDVSTGTTSLAASRQGGQQANTSTIALLMLIVTVVGLAVAVAARI